MFTNSFLKLKTSNKEHRFVHSDNLSSYFTISDFKNEFDGLWSYGFHIFKGFSPEERANKQRIDSKLNSPIGVQINFHKRSSVVCYLLKNGDGFIIELLKNRFLLKFNKKTQYFFDIGRDFEIIEKNINRFILKYVKGDREGYEADELFLSISPAANCSFENVEKKDNGILISLKYKDKDESNPELYLCYATSYENMREIRDKNVAKLDKLKKQHIKNSYLPLKYLSLQTEDSTFNKAFVWSMISGGSFVMQKAGSIGIWAGFPWFDNNWGRDTFISIPGISLVSGRYEEAWQIIESFIKRQDVDPKSKSYGKIPNVVFNEANILYNTADATPLLIREAYEYYLYTGDYNSIMSILSSLIFAVDNAYISKKDKNNFIAHNDSDDWMDAKREGKDSYSPRGDKAVEIQALWYTSLMALTIIVENIIGLIQNKIVPSYDLDVSVLSEKLLLYKEQGDKLKESINSYFTTDSEPYIIDHFNKDYTPDGQVRPNGLLAIYYSRMPKIPKLFTDETCVKYLKFISPKLIYKYGVSSLSKYDGDFHPTHINEKYHKDAAYHNGANWLWLSGAFVNVAVGCGYQNLAFAHTSNLKEQLLSVGALGTLSELNDPYYKGEVRPGGTYSQAWSCSEFTRSVVQDYIGLRQDVPQRKLYITPNIPILLGTVKASVRYGMNESLSLYIRLNKRSGKIAYMDIRGLDLKKQLTVVCKINLGNVYSDERTVVKTQKIIINLSQSGDSFRANFDYINERFFKLKDISLNAKAEVKNISLKYEYINENLVQKIEFAKNISDDEYNSYNSVKEQNFLENKITKKGEK